MVVTLVTKILVVGTNVDTEITTDEDIDTLREWVTLVKKGGFDHTPCVQWLLDVG